MKILIAEDHKIVREGLVMLLRSTQGIEVVGEAENGQQVLEIINTGTVPDVVLTDVNMPVVDGLTLIEKLKGTYPAIKVVMLSMHDNEKYMFDALDKGADGYLLKSMDSAELLFALNRIKKGNTYISCDLSFSLLGKLRQQVPTRNINQLDIDFSVREIEVLQLIAEGLTNSEMADKIFISRRTIEGHRQSLLDKTKSKNTAALIRFAVLNGIVV